MIRTATKLLVVALIGASLVHSQNVDGDWSPWEADPEIDCCMYGGWERVHRYCNNPSPEGTGSKCRDDDGILKDMETRWRGCPCECEPACDGVTAFCANDTGAAAHCVCNYGKILERSTDPNQIMSCSAPEPEPTTTPEPKSYPTMDPETKRIIKIVQTTAITWLLVCLFTCLGLFFMLCAFKPDRVIQMNEEISLAVTHILIVFLAETTDPQGLCKMSSILIHYFFLVCLTFFCLEAIHTYSMVTFVVPKNGYFHSLINLAIGYGLPILPVAISFGVLFNKYGENNRHCWCSMDNAQAWAFIVPITLFAFVCTVIAEAQGQGTYKELPDTDQAEFTSARVSQGSIMIIMPLTVASYVIGMIAVDRQNLYLYSIFSLLNTILGPIIFFFHTIGNSKLRALLAKIFFCFPCFKKKPGDGSNQGEVGPGGDGAGGDEEDPNGGGPGGDGSGDDGSGGSGGAGGPNGDGTGGEGAGGPGSGNSPPDKDDTNWKDFHKWVMDGKDDNINQAGNRLDLE